MRPGFLRAWLSLLAGILLGALAASISGCAHVTLAHCNDLGEFIEVVNVRPDDYRTRHGYYLPMPPGWTPDPRLRYTCDDTTGFDGVPDFLHPWVKD